MVIITILKYGLGKHEDGNIDNDETGDNDGFGT